MYRKNDNINMIPGYLKLIIINLSCLTYYYKSNMKCSKLPIFIKEQVTKNHWCVTIFIIFIILFYRFSVNN